MHLYVSHEESLISQKWRARFYFNSLEIHYFSNSNHHESVHSHQQGGTLRGVAARSIVTPSLSGIDLFPAANYEIDVNAAHANSIDGLGRLYGRQGLTRAYGTASLSPAFLGQIKEKVGPEMIDAAAMGAVSQVQTLRLTGTSPWHTDCEMDGHQKRSLKKDKLQVGLFFSNTNEEPTLTFTMATFVFPLLREPSSHSMVVHPIALS
jgi:hypothetical protein